MSTSLSWLRAEVQQRMLDKLEPIKLMPKQILIEPDFSGLNRSAFAKRFPGARIDTILDPQLRVSSRLGLKLKRLLGNAISSSGRVLDGNLLNRASYDLMISNLCLQNLKHPNAWLANAQERLTEGALISFSYLGPDTGKEIREVGQDKGVIQDLPGALDMHDIGDALVQNRYSDPVMDMEYLFLEYETEQALFHDGLALGLIAPDTPMDWFRAPNPLKLTLEIVYGHAWVLAKNLSTGNGKTTYIRVDAIKRK